MKNSRKTQTKKKEQVDYIPFDELLLKAIAFNHSKTRKKKGKK